MAGLVVSVGTVAALAKLGVPAAKRRSATSPARVARRLDRLGGAYLKVGQILSTRADLLAEAQRAPFARLCDQATPVRADGGLPSPGSGWAEGLIDVESAPLATGSVTHVHVARRRDTGQRVVVKVLRGDARARFAADLAFIRGFTRVGARMPLFSSVPMIDSVKLLSDAVAAHLDLTVEAARHAQMAAAFDASRSVVVPRPHLDLCTRDALVMDCIAGARRIDDPLLDSRRQRSAALAAVRALYTMLFGGGLVHCDLHPGNMLVGADGKLVLIDFGYVSQLTDDQQTAFAELFKAMMFRDARGAAHVVVGTASRLPARLDREALVADLDELVGKVSGSTAAEFNVAGFVTRLFAIQRRHDIVASSGFAMGIVALVTLEGTLKQLTPTLNFQREAMPFVMRRLSAAQAQRRRAAST